MSPLLDQLADTGGCTQWGYSFHQSSLPAMPCQFDRYNGDFSAHAHLLTCNHPPLGWQHVLGLSGAMVSSLFKFCSAYICSPLYTCALLRSGYPLPPDRGLRYSESPCLRSLPEGRGLSVPASCRGRRGRLYPSPSAS